MKGLALLTPPPLALAPPLFPHPTPYIFITSHPDPSASLSQQFAQWVYGPYLALTLNVTYTYTPLLKLSSRWGSFLGFGYDELMEADLLASFARTRLFVRNVDDAGAEGGGKAAEVEDWVREKRKKVEHMNKQIVDWHRKVSTIKDLPYPKVDEPKGSVLDGYATHHIDPTSPITTATVFRLYRLAVPSLQAVCHPPLLRLLRQKYCAARVRKAVAVDLFGEDRRGGRMIVAIHIVCGDSCYNTEKTFPVSSYIHTMQRLTAVAALHHLPPPSFHVFTVPPANDSSLAFFDALKAQPFVRLHVSHHSHAVFHHLVVADVLIPPSITASSTSWLVQLLHAGVVVGPSTPPHACTGEVGMYNRETGGFDEDSFVQIWQQLGGHQIKYETLQDCYAIT